MSYEAAIVAAGVELIKFIIEKVLEAEKTDKTGEEKHEDVKKQVCEKCDDKHVDNLIKFAVDQMNGQR